MRILIAEDDPTNRRLLQGILERLGHDVVAVANGAAAWERLVEEQLDFVISDWMMPGLDGLELCRRIRGAGFVHYTYVILLTARGAKNDLVEGLSAGADDFLVKPCNPEELDARLRAGERVVALHHELAAHNDRLRHAKAIIDKDLRAAADMQLALLPDAQTVLPGIDLSWLFLPCSQIAGDIFNFFQVGHHQIGFYLLDVAGHGIPSAMLSFTLSKLLTPSPWNDSPVTRATNEAPYRIATPPAELVRELNDRFQDSSDAMKYFTMIYGIIDVEHDRLRFCQAGHPSPVLVQDGSITLLGDGGFPVGLMPGVCYTEREVAFRPGDRLILYSDGVTECENDANHQYSSIRLLERIAERHASPLDQLIGTVRRAVETWHARATFADDVTVVAVERRARA